MSPATHANEWLAFVNTFANWRLNLGSVGGFRRFESQYWLGCNCWETRTDQWHLKSSDYLIRTVMSFWLFHRLTKFQRQDFLNFLRFSWLWINWNLVSKFDCFLESLSNVYLTYFGVFSTLSTWFWCCIGEHFPCDSSFSPTTPLVFAGWSSGALLVD